MAGTLSTELAVEGIELEAFVSDIPDLQAKFDRLQTRLKKGATVKQCSFQTNRGGVQRAPFWASVRVQGGAPIQQFGNDTATTAPAYGRGSAGQFVSMAASPVRFVSICEISNLANEATDGKERGLVKFGKEEMNKSLLAHDNGIEALLNRDGSGTIDTVVTPSSGSGSAGPAFSYIVVNNAASFVDQQTVQVLSAVGGTNRGSFAISYVDPVAQRIYTAAALPSTGGATAAGDILVVQGATGAAGSSVYGKDYWIQNGNVGTKGGVDISQYPGRFSSPTINFGGSGTIVNSTALRVQSIRMRAMGDDYEKNEKAFWYGNPIQGIALAGNYYNPGYTRLDEGGNERVPDVAKRYMQDKWADEEVVWSSTAETNRLDRIVPSAFTFGELYPTRLHEWTPGNTVAAVPVNDGGGNTYYDSTMFAYETAFNILCPEMKAQFFIQNLPVPADA